MDTPEIAVSLGFKGKVGAVIDSGDLNFGREEDDGVGEAPDFAAVDRGVVDYEAEAFAVKYECLIRRLLNLKATLK